MVLAAEKWVRGQAARQAQIAELGCSLQKAARMQKSRREAVSSKAPAMDCAGTFKISAAGWEIKEKKETPTYFSSRKNGRVF